MRIFNIYKSKIDNTIKYQFRTNDEYIVEACLIFFESEVAPINICVSSQIGCMCKCTFCATGYKRFVRNLKSEEIVDQVKLVFLHNPEILNKRFEITYMGTGDPFNNLNEVLSSLKYFENNFADLHRINISTIAPHVNVAPQQFIETKKPIHFQYSLHFLTDNLRNIYFQNKLVPICDALNFFNTISRQTNEDFCINYLLFDGVNDSVVDAENLIRLCHSLKAYIKISHYCPVENSTLRPSQNFKQFADILDQKGIRWKPFISKGNDIKASCGHLLSDVDF